RRASCRNAVLQYVLNCFVETPPFTHSEPVSPPARTDSGPKACLIGVDIAHARQKRLIEQGRLDGPSAGPDEAFEVGFGQVPVNWLGAQPRRAGARRAQLVHAAHDQPSE